MNNLSLATEIDLKGLIQEAVNEALSKYQPVETELLRPKEVQVMLGNCSRSHLDNIAETDPDFPRPIYLGNRWKAYHRKKILDYLDKKAMG